MAYNSPHDGNIADFNDATWLNAFYSIDGKRIVALGHMEYHGWEHAGMCAPKTDSASCWYNVDTFNLSEDGGYHFVRPKPPTNYLFSLPYKYQVNQGPEGYSVDANIVKVASGTTMRCTHGAGRQIAAGGKARSRAWFPMARVPFARRIFWIRCLGVRDLQVKLKPPDVRPSNLQTHR